MSVLLSKSLSVDAIKVRWQEPYVSAGLNRKFLGVLPKGVYVGFQVKPNTTLGAFNVDVATDPALGYSIAVVNENTGGSYGVSIVLDSTLTFDLSASANQSVYLAIDVQYAIGAASAAQVVVVDAAELSANPDLIVLARVDVPSAGPIPSTAINQAYTSVAAENRLTFAKASPNLMSNGGFEQAMISGTTQIPGWYYSYPVPSGLVVAALDENNRGGSRALKISASAGGVFHIGSELMRVTSGNQYLFSSWLRSSASSPITVVSGGTGVEIRVNFLDATGAIVAGGDVLVDGVFTGGGTSYVQKANVISAPAGAWFARMVVKLNSVNGTVYVDDCEMREFSPRNELAGYLQNPRKYIGGLELPLDLFTLPEDVSANKQFTILPALGTQVFTADAGNLGNLLQWGSVAAGSNLDLGAANSGTRLYLGRFGGVLTYSDGFFQIGNIESGDSTGGKLRLECTGGQAQVTFGKNGSADKTLTYDKVNTLVGGLNADSLHVHGAANISFTPTGNIASTNVAAALSELDSEKGGISITNAWSGANTFNGATTLQGNVTFGSSSVTTFNNGPTFGGSPTFNSGMLVNGGSTSFNGDQFNINTKTVNGDSLSVTGNGTGNAIKGTTSDINGLAILGSTSVVGGIAIKGDATSGTGGTGIFGLSTGHTAVLGQSTDGIGVEGSSTNGVAVYGTSTNFYGVKGVTSGTAAQGGVLGDGGSYGAGVIGRGTAAGDFRFSSLRSADPVAPQDGDMWIRTDTGQLCIRMGGVIKRVSLA